MHVLNLSLPVKELLQSFPPLLAHSAASHSSISSFCGLRFSALPPLGKFAGSQFLSFVLSLCSLRERSAFCVICLMCHSLCVMCSTIFILCNYLYMNLHLLKYADFNPSVSARLMYKLLHQSRQQNNIKLNALV